MFTWAAMYQAAQMRHAALVCAMYPAGPARDAAMAHHYAFVRAFYWGW